MRSRAPGDTPTKRPLKIWTTGRAEFGLSIEHAFARTSATLLAAACIIGLAVVMQFCHPQAWERWLGVVFWIAVAFAIVDYIKTLLNLPKGK